uniref:Uncharacterized protein n=1 Tax=Spongospora subterranea TaxID=70186 RepID=A0A0H5QRS2_9EUKA|eukprot:CRZ04316.1 hypothetical protein [Spongospora subterranea]
MATDPISTASLGLASIKRMKSHATRASKSSPAASVGQLTLLRLSTFDQIRNAHEPEGAMWLGMVRVDAQLIARQKSAKHLSVEELFVLGLSCSRLLVLTNGVDLSRAMLLLFEEFEVRFSSHREVIPSALPKPVDGREPLPGASSISNTKPTVAKWGKKSVFEVLVNTNIPCDLDYTFTVINICDVLTLLYIRLRDLSCPEDAFIKIDERIREIVIVPIVHRLKRCSYEVIDQEIRKIKFRYKLGRATTHRSVIAIGEGVDDEEPDFKKMFEL